MEPLAQLKDIHLPEPIANYPLAIGWWLLMLVLISILTFVGLQLKKRYLLSRSKKQAIKRLNSQVASNTLTMSIIKWAAMQYFPRIDVASLYGEKFQQFLITSLPEKHQPTFIALSEKTINNYYAPVNIESTDEEFRQAAILWLKQALPPKKPEVHAK